MSANIELKDYPGTPGNRSLLAFEPTDAQIKQVFQDNPGSQYLVTPTRIMERWEFFTAQDVGSTASSARVDRDET